MTTMQRKLHESAARWYRNAWPEYKTDLIRTWQKTVDIAIPDPGMEDPNLPGRPDFILDRPNRFYHFLAIELRLPFGAKNEEQRAAWQRAVEQRQGKYVYCRTLADFTRAVNQYLGDL